MESDDQFGHWFAGFVDGEGCFIISKRATAHTCFFVIMLRVDDLPILKEIHDRFKIGNLSFTPPRVTMSRPDYPATHRATATWTVCRKAHVLQLIAILDRYPLRAKKRGDYQIWREAVMIWNDHVHNRCVNGVHVVSPAQKQIAELKDKLVAHRQLSTP